MAVVSNLIEICNAFAQHDCCGLHACIGTLKQSHVCAYRFVTIILTPNQEMLQKPW